MISSVVRRWRRCGNLLELRTPPRSPRSLVHQRPVGIDVDGGEVYTCRPCRVDYHDPLAGAWDGPGLCRRCGGWLEVVNYSDRWSRRRASKARAA